MHSSDWDSESAYSAVSYDSDASSFTGAPHGGFTAAVAAGGGGRFAAGGGAAPAMEQYLESQIGNVELPSMDAAMMTTSA